MKTEPSTPKLIVIGGFAGAGKSTLGRSLGKALALPVYELDLVGQAIGASPDFSGAKGNAKGVAYDLFWSFSRAHLTNGNSLIFDQNMGQVYQWKKLREVCASVPGAELKIFLLDCPFELCIERFKARTEHPDLESTARVNIHDHKFKWDYLNDNEFPDAIRIDATRTQEEVFVDVISHFAP